MRIANNLPALTAFKSLNATNQNLQKTINALSTGLRINSASDDAAGFAISEKMRSQLSGLNLAARNSQDGISLLQTADGALGEVNSMLQRMRELAVQASNDSLTSNDRQYLQLEIDELKDQIDRIANTTQFNKKRILDGSSGAIWSSSDLNIKAKINGGLTYIDEFGQKVSAEGNYRIVVNAEGGRAQVQKSNIMLIKHKNVTMDRTINNSAGVNGISVNDLPAGYYSLNGEPPTEARAFATGAYGIGLNELDESLSATVTNSLLLSNASILFEVTDADSESGNITVRASANILKTDGTNDFVTMEGITLKEGAYNDLSSVLKVGLDGADADEPDGAFELQLLGGAAGNFKVGDKFVYNLNVAEGVEGADRVVRIENEINPSWPGAWEETEQVFKTNQFQGVEPINSSAKVLFLIDFSGSMGRPITTVRDNIRNFINEIKSKSGGATDVQIGIATYVDGLQRRTFSDGTYWTSDIGKVTSLLSFAPRGGDVDAYKSIREAVASTEYGMSDVGGRYMVLITDTCQEYSDRFPIGAPRYTTSEFEDLKQDVIKDLQDNGIMFSAVRPETLDWEEAYYAAEDDQAMRDFDEIISGTGGVAMNQRDVSNWGRELVSKLGDHIGEDVMSMVGGVPLYKFVQFEPLFPDSSSSSRTITISKDGVTTEVEILPTDTFKTLGEKIDAVLGSMTSLEITVGEDEDFLSIKTLLEDGSKIKFGGDREFLNTLGMRSSFEQKFSLNASEVKSKNVHFRQYYIDPKSGHVYDSDIVMTTDDDIEIEEWGAYSKFEAAYVGQIPKEDVKLRDINKFWNSQGVFMLDSPQTLTITQGDGQSTSVTLYASDTIADVRNKLNDAIGYDLGQIRHTDANNFVSYVREGEALSYGEEAVEGTMLIRSAIPGKVGELYFSGDEDLLNALGLNTIQESEEATFTASIYDAHTGIPAGVNVKASGNVFREILPNVDVEFDPMAGFFASWDEKTRRFVTTHKDSYEVVLHLKNSGTVFQVGANEGEDFIIQLGDSSTDALGISNVNLLTRETASRAISALDAAITKVSSQRAKIGSYENALEYTMENLTTTSANLTNAESRIRDADMSLMMMKFVKYQILNQSGTSMLAQANQLPQSIMSLLQ